MSKLHDANVDDFLIESVKIEPLALEEEYVRLPADLAYWSHKYAEAMRVYLVSKIDLDRVFARLRIETRENLELVKGKVTESMVDSAVETSPELATAKLASVEAEVEKVRLYGVLDAIRTKKDMLISLGAHVRLEMSNDPQIREEQRGRRLVRYGG